MGRECVDWNSCNIIHQSMQLVSAFPLLFAIRPSVPLVLLCAQAAAPDAEEMCNRLSPVALAYLGDSVFEQAVRQRLLWPPAKINIVSSRVQKIVCAEGQAALLAHVRKGFGLTEDEEDWLRRGRNASPRGPRRLDPNVYRASTALECLVGYLHMTDGSRCQALLDYCLSDDPEAIVLREDESE